MVKPSKNYYGILDVTSDASQEEIKAAYRKKAKQYHPDHYGQDRDRAPFLDVQEAYEVLSDPAQREDYDETRDGQSRGTASGPSRTWPRGGANPTSRGHVTPEPLRPRRSPVDPLRGASGTQPASPSPDPFAMFDAFFDHMWGRARPRPSPHHASPDLHVEISLTRAQASRGGEIRLSIPVPTPCPVCRRQERRQMWSVQDGYRCQACHGEGVVTKQHPVSIPFPAGVQDNTTLFASLAPIGLQGVRLAMHFNVT